MKTLFLSLAGFLSLVASARPALADFLIYRLPVKNKTLALVLEGEVRSAGRLIALKHAQHGKLVFSRKNVSYYEVTSIPDQLNGLMVQAAGEENSQLLLDLGRRALKHGYLRAYYKAAQVVGDFDSANERARMILDLKAELERTIPPSEELEKELRELIRVPTFKVARSRHFILLHDLPTSNLLGDGKEESRVEVRLDLMEKVYESFFQFFAARGVKLNVPDKRLKGVLFNNKADFEDFAHAESPSLPGAAGFWNSEINTTFFFEHATDEGFMAWKELADKLNDIAKQAIRERVPNRAELIRLAKTLDVLLKVERENADITVVSHELVHQLAGSTNLLPRDVPMPVWVHEGLATFFEAPRDATWSGIGAVNDERLDCYRALAEDREHSNIEFIAADKIFHYAGSRDTTLHAYGQSWALTHFLMERHFDQLIRFYRRLADHPVKIEKGKTTVETVQKAYLDNFNELFPAEERRHLDLEWRNYMRSLRTDLEQAIAGKEESRSHAGSEPVLLQQSGGRSSSSGSSEHRTRHSGGRRAR